MADKSSHDQSSQGEPQSRSSPPLRRPSLRTRRSRPCLQQQPERSLPQGPDINIIGRKPYESLGNVESKLFPIYAPVTMLNNEEMFSSLNIAHEPSKERRPDSNGHSQGSTGRSPGFGGLDTSSSSQSSSGGDQFAGSGTRPSTSDAQPSSSGTQNPEYTPPTEEEKQKHLDKTYDDYRNRRYKDGY